MPIETCTRKGKSGKRWGKHGRCYLGKGASAKAGKQAAAARANGYEGHAECNCGGKCDKCKATPFAEGLRIRGAEIFAAGTHRGKVYSEKDLDDIVRNFERYSVGRKPLLRVPAVIGHEENQDYLERSDLPAAAWCSRVYREGPKLLADFEDVSPKVARLLNGKAYRTVSAEIYDEPPEGIDGKGKMLRRVAFLGGEIPQVKSLDEIPTPEAHAESPYRATVIRFKETYTKPGLGFYSCFSEVEPMDKEQLMKALTEMGFDMEAFKGLPDDQFLAIGNDILRVYSQEEEGDAPGKKPDVEEHEEPQDPTAQAATGYHLAEDDYAKMPPEKQNEYNAKLREAARRMNEKGTPLTDQSYPGDHQPDPKAGQGYPGGAKKMSEQQIVDAVFKRVEKAIAGKVDGSIDRLQKFTDETERNTRRKMITAFAEEMKTAGKVMPSELDASSGRPTLVDRLMLLDSTKPAAKFKEKGKAVERSQLELEMDAIRDRPAIFKEHVKEHHGAASHEEDEVAKIGSHFERFAEQFRGMNTSKDEMVKAFQSQRKRNPKLTADEFLGTTNGAA